MVLLPTDRQAEFGEANPVELRTRLLAWYRRTGRDLPWRHTRDPYAIWVSEIMLQQTQVKTAIPYYWRWLAAFPTVEALAEADLQQVLKLWEGLGYYARARNLHTAARQIVDKYAGCFPVTFAEVNALPGIGRSTAGAILSSAFNQCHPLLDANVRRVLSRLYAIAEPPHRTETLWKRSATLVDPAFPHDFNQAIMDLGATVCVPRSPHCLLCPWQLHCHAYRSGEPERFPVKATRPERGQLNGVSVLIEYRGEFLLVRRPASGLLGGLWEFPYLELPDGCKPVDYLRSVFPAIKVGRAYGIVTHDFTHRRLSTQVYAAQWQGMDRSLPSTFVGREVAWVQPAAWPHFPMPGFVHKIIALWSGTAPQMQKRTKTDSLRFLN